MPVFRPLQDRPERHQHFVLGLLDVLKQQRLTQARLARRAEIDPAKVSRIINGRTALLPATENALARAVDHDVHLLIEKGSQHRQELMDAQEPTTESTSTPAPMTEPANDSAPFNAALELLDALAPDELVRLAYAALQRTVKPQDDPGQAEQAVTREAESKPRRPRAGRQRRSRDQR